MEIKNLNVQSPYLPPIITKKRGKDKNSLLLKLRNDDQSACFWNLRQTSSNCKSNSGGFKKIVSQKYEVIKQLEPVHLKVSRSVLPVPCSRPKLHKTWRID